MVRTEIFLTEQEQQVLQELAQRSGCSQDELIHQAIVDLIGEAPTRDRRAGFERIRGLWKDRDDLPDFEALRRESDRFLTDLP
jgi:hypothetical protein